MGTLPARGMDGGGSQCAGPLRLPPLRQCLAVLVAPRVCGAMIRKEGFAVTRVVEAVKKDWALFALLGLWLFTCLAWRW